MSSQELAGDMAEAEQLLRLHEELGQEIKVHCLQAQDVKQEGQQLVDNGNFMSLEVHGPGIELGTAQLPKASEPLAGLKPVGEEGQAKGRERGTEKGKVQASQPSLHTSGHSNPALLQWLCPASHPQSPLPTR